MSTRREGGVALAVGAEDVRLPQAVAIVLEVLLEVSAEEEPKSISRICILLEAHRLRTSHPIKIG